MKNTSLLEALAIFCCFLLGTWIAVCIVLFSNAYLNDDEGVPAQAPSGAAWVPSQKTATPAGHYAP